jgi:hypothetical protein
MASDGERDGGGGGVCSSSVDDGRTTGAPPFPARSPPASSSAAASAAASALCRAREDGSAWSSRPLLVVDGSLRSSWGDMCSLCLHALTACAIFSRVSAVGTVLVPLVIREGWVPALRTAAGAALHNGGPPHDAAMALVLMDEGLAALLLAGIAALLPAHRTRTLLCLSLSLSPTCGLCALLTSLYPRGEERPLSASALAAERLAEGGPAGGGKGGLAEGGLAAASGAASGGGRSGGGGRRGGGGGGGGGNAGGGGDVGNAGDTAGGASGGGGGGGREGGRSSIAMGLCVSVALAAALAPYAAAPAWIACHGHLNYMDALGEATGNEVARVFWREEVLRLLSLALSVMLCFRYVPTREVLPGGLRSLEFLLPLKVWVAPLLVLVYATPTAATACVLWAHLQRARTRLWQAPAPALPRPPAHARQRRKGGHDDGAKGGRGHPPGRGAMGAQPPPHPGPNAPPPPTPPMLGTRARQVSGMI